MATYADPWSCSGAGCSYVSNFTLSGADDTNTDTGTLYGVFKRDPADDFDDTSVKLYSDSGRTTLVAQYATGNAFKTGTGLVLSEISGSGLSGAVDIASSPNGTYNFELTGSSAGVAGTVMPCCCGVTPSGPCGCTGSFTNVTATVSGFTDLVCFDSDTPAEIVNSVNVHTPVATCNHTIREFTSNVGVITQNGGCGCGTFLPSQIDQPGYAYFFRFDMFSDGTDLTLRYRINVPVGVVDLILDFETFTLIPVPRVRNTAEWSGETTFAIKACTSIDETFSLSLTTTPTDFTAPDTEFFNTCGPPLDDTSAQVRIQFS